MTAPYRGVRHAIRAAYASEVAEVFGRTPTTWIRKPRATDGPDGPLVGDPLVGSAWQERVSSNGPKPQGYLELYEHIAEGHWCMALIRDTLDDDLMTVADAYFTVMGEPLLEVRKYAATVRLAGMVMQSGVYGYCDHDYAVAAVAQWAGFGALNPRTWSEHLGVTKRTLRNWRHGREPWGVGIEDRLRVYLAEVEYTLTDPMAERRLVFRPDEPFCYANRRDIKKRSAKWSGVLRLRTRETSDERTDIRAAA